MCGRALRSVPGLCCSAPTALVGRDAGGVHEIRVYPRGDAQGVKGSGVWRWWDSCRQLGTDLQRRETCNCSSPSKAINELNQL